MKITRPAIEQALSSISLPSSNINFNEQKYIVSKLEEQLKKNIKL